MPVFGTYWSGLTDGVLSDAGKVGITDTGGAYTSTNVDGALDEIAAGTTLDARYEPLQLIHEASLATASTYTISSIPATFSDLELVVHGELTSPQTAGRTLYLRFNGDSGSNYDYSWSEANGTSTTLETESYASSFIAVGRSFSDVGPSSARVVIPEYSGTTLEKTTIGSFVGKTGTSAGGLWRQASAGWWRNTDAISSITLLMNTGADSWATGSVVRLFGRK